MKRHPIVAVGTIVIVAFLAVVALIEAGMPLGGISRADAVAAAERQVPSTAQQSASWALVAPLPFSS